MTPPLRRQLKTRGDVRRMLLARGWSEPTPGRCVDPADTVTWYELHCGESALVGGGPSFDNGGRHGWEIRFFQNTPAGVIAAACVGVAGSEAGR